MTPEQSAAIAGAINKLAACRAQRDIAETRLYIANSEFEAADKQVAQCRTRLNQLIETAINEAAVPAPDATIITLSERRSRENSQHGA